MHVRHLNLIIDTFYMDEDEKSIIELKKEIKDLEFRLSAIEKEQRLIREDILSGEPIERMKKRLLTNPPDDIEEVKKKINNQIKFDI